METIFHEKQEGSLCAQHCLNSLLQGPYFSAVDLASIAQDLDDAEKDRMAEGDVNSLEYLRFLEQPSANMDDSGFFSVQVISNALSVWELKLLPIGSTEAGAAAIHPERECAFICNFREHWLTIRKLGHQWFNLNSLLTGPELITDTYLSMFLAQLQRDGYSIFVVRGSLPECEAHQLLELVPAVQTTPPKLLSDLVQSPASSDKTTTSSGVGVTQDDLQRALEASTSALPTVQDQDETNLQEAIKLSLQASACSSSSEAAKPIDVEEMRRRREAYFNQQTASQPSSGNDETCRSRVPPLLPSSGSDDRINKRTESTNTNNSAETSAGSGVDKHRRETDESVGATPTAHTDEDLTESAMLEAAIRMSMESAEQKT